MNERQALLRAVEAEGIVRTSVIAKELLSVPEQSKEHADLIAAHIAEEGHDNTRGGSHGVNAEGQVFHYGQRPICTYYQPGEYQSFLDVFLAST